MDVIFRKFRSDSAVIAYFPSMAADSMLEHCQSYMHVGQHGAASTYYCSAHTAPATPEEYSPLLTELRSIGYENLRIVKRFTAKHRAQRLAAIR